MTSGTVAQIASASAQLAHHIARHPRHEQVPEPLIEDDLHGLGVPGMISVGRVVVAAAGVADAAIDDDDLSMCAQIEPRPLPELERPVEAHRVEPGQLATGIDQRLEEPPR